MILKLKNSGQFKKGSIPHNKGKKRPKELKQIQSASMKKRFADGLVPWNKGTKGIAKPNSGSFKKGNSYWKKYGFKKGQAPTEGSFKKGHKPNSTSFKKGQKPWNAGTTGIYSEEYRKKIKEKRLHQVFPKKDSKIEKILQEGLKKRKIPFTTHVPIIGQPDILIEPSICVFADSDWFHGYTYMSGHDCSKYKMLNNEYFEKKIQSDKEKTQSLTVQGYKVLRFWEHEIMKNPEECLQEIIKIIKESRR